MRILFCFAVCVCASASHAFASGIVIDDRSFFDKIPTTFLDFETKGDGSSVDLPFQGRQLFNSDEYIKSGVNFQSIDPFSSGMKWINIPPPSADTSLGGNIGDSLDAVGSWPTAIGGGNDWTMTFTVPVHSVGIGVVQGNWGFTRVDGKDVPLKELQTRMRTFDQHGRLLGEVFFWDDLVDGGFGGLDAGGTFGEEFVANPFGFLGIFSPDTPIAKVQFTHSATIAGVIFDDLHFSALPAPGAGAALGLAALGMGFRRRR